MKVPDVLLKPILKKTGQAIADYKLIEDGDRILIGISGGKDSWALLKTLVMLQKKAPVHFELHAAKVDYPHTVEDNRIIEDACREILTDFMLIETDIEEIISQNINQNKSHCAFCARLRRGFLTTHAVKNGFNKIALGHHREDFNETLLMNLFFSGTLASMPVKYQIERHLVEVIRPLALTAEDDIKAYIQQSGLPVIHNRCKYADENQRAQMKTLIEMLSETYPGIKNSLMAAQTNILHSHLPIVK